MLDGVDGRKMMGRDSETLRTLECYARAVGALRRAVEALAAHCPPAMIQVVAVALDGASVRGSRCAQPQWARR